MDLELPERLHGTRDLLTRSLVTHPHEKAPAMPADLAADLMARFQPQQAEKQASPSPTWFQRACNFLATPAFGAVAAAVVVIGIAMPMLSGPGSKTAETFRGGDTAYTAASAVRIVLVGENSGQRTALEASGDFESSSFVDSSSVSAIEDVPGPKVIIDFPAGMIRGLSDKGTLMYQTAIPEDAVDLAPAVADVVSRL
ncbi:hypothetical protein [Luteolibacter marinus]|uniref:hypothetical protein n=1 Tax=Luteolibacter marinus TaxID=2776705 RepID=UPI0018688F2A|nr:hypothetical protein [Luteolibacter marinus]